MTTGQYINEPASLWRDNFGFGFPWVDAPTYAGKWLVQNPENGFIFNAYVRDDLGKLQSRIITVDTEYKSISSLTGQGWTQWKGLEL